MNVKYLYDQDPRYGWVSVDLEGKPEALVVIHTTSGSVGFNFSEETGKMTPTCICHAFYKEECCCPDVEWDDDKT